MFRKAFAFVLLGLGLLVAKAPATVLDLALQEAFDGMVRLEQAEGSLWQGRASLLLQGAMHAPIAWQFAPDRLLRGELLWKSAPGSALQGELAIGPGGLSLHEVRFNAPAGLVLPLFPGTLAHAGWDGKLSLHAEEWSCNKGKSCRGRLHLQWQDARCTLLPDLRFGSYAIEFHGAGQRINLVARTLAGIVEITGEGSIGTDGQDGAFTGRITAPPHILGLLPGIAAGIVHPDGKSGSLGIAYPARFAGR
jgi:general secretion pathway protein N